MSSETGLTVLITGAAGMLGQKLAARLVSDGHLGRREVRRLVLCDLAPITIPCAPTCAATVEAHDADIRSAEQMRVLVGTADVVFHLAGVVSGAAESDPAGSFEVNVGGTRNVLEGCRRAATRRPPRVVFASSLAVFGGALPEAVSEGAALAPSSTYGAHKAIAELLVADYTRRHHISGVALRLPTVSVRPGNSNRAASGYLSAVVRDVLRGLPATVPVPRDWRAWVASPRSAVGFLVHAGSLDERALRSARVLNMPGVSVSVSDQLCALQGLVGDGALRRVTDSHSDHVMNIVRGWPAALDARRAEELGFVGDVDFAAILRAYIEDDLGPSRDLHAWRQQCM